MGNQWFFGRMAILVLLLSLSVTGCIQPMTMPPSTLEAAGHRPLKELVGAWRVVITAEIQKATFPGLLTFTSDGIVLGDEPPSPFETTAHGNWVTTGPNAASFTFIALIGSAEGPTKLSATLKVVGALEYDAQSDSWHGPFRIWINDPNGQELLADSGTFQGTRIAVETVEQEDMPRMSAAENKPILAIFDPAADSAEQYDQIVQALEAAGAGSPPGRLYHVAYAKDTAIVVVDVWESSELLDEFAQTLVPVLQELGVTPTVPQLYPVHNMIKQ